MVRVLLATGFLVSAGCGGGGGAPVSAKGVVTFDGKPVDEGSISFEPADGQGPTLGGTIEGGRYECSGPSGAGAKRVRIRGVLKTGRKIEVGPPSPKGVMVDEIKGPIPPAYNDKSTLTADLAAGKANECNFALDAVK